MLTTGTFSNRMASYWKKTYFWIYLSMHFLVNMHKIPWFTAIFYESIYEWTHTEPYDSQVIV